MQRDRASKLLSGGTFHSWPWRGEHPKSGTHIFHVSAASSSTHGAQLCSGVFGSDIYTQGCCGCVLLVTAMLISRVLHISHCMLPCQEMALPHPCGLNREQGGNILLRGTAKAVEVGSQETAWQSTPSYFVKDLTGTLEETLTFSGFLS